MASGGDHTLPWGISPGILGDSATRPGPGPYSTSRGHGLMGSVVVGRGGGGTRAPVQPEDRSREWGNGLGGPALFTLPPVTLSVGVLAVPVLQGPGQLSCSGGSGCLVLLELRAPLLPRPESSPALLHHMSSEAPSPPGQWLIIWLDSVMPIGQLRSWCVETR